MENKNSDYGVVFFFLFLLIVIFYVANNENRIIYGDREYINNKLNGNQTLQDTHK